MRYMSGGHSAGDDERVERGDMVRSGRDRYMRAARLKAAALSAGLAVAAIGAGCGASATERVVVRVQGAAITDRAVEHWAVALQHAAVDTGAAPAGGSWTQKAVDFLITAHWLLDEASRLDVAPSSAALRRRLDERSEAVPGGESAFVESLQASGRTVADVELELRRELAVEELRRAALGTVQEASAGSIAAYYRAHERDYRTPERRYIDIVERLQSPGVARALAARVGSGTRLARIAFHEAPERPPHFTLSTEKGRVVHAIFQARPGVLTGPMRLNHEWALFVVRRVVPAGTRPLKKVRASILDRLEASVREQALARFAGALRLRWRPSTSCQAGFVVAGCVQDPAAATDANLLGGG
jgi:hypothetical protein